MPKLNVEGTRKWEPRFNRGYAWQQFKRDDGHCLPKVRSALTTIRMLIAGNVRCNEAFRALPGKRSLDELMRDQSIWVSSDPSDAEHRFGATLENEITITRRACTSDPMVLVSTLVHELAHVNGANSEAAAEGILKECLLGKYYNPRVINDLSSASRASGIVDLNNLLRWGPRAD